MTENNTQQPACEGKQVNEQKRHHHHKSGHHHKAGHHHHHHREHGHGKPAGRSECACCCGHSGKAAAMRQEG